MNCLCPYCNKEVKIVNGEYYDYSFPTVENPKGSEEPHSCNEEVKRTVKSEPLSTAL